MIVVVFEKHERDRTSEFSGVSKFESTKTELRKSNRNTLLLGCFKCKSLASSNKTGYVCSIREVNRKGDKDDVVILIGNMVLVFEIKIFILVWLENLSVLLKVKIVAIFICNNFVSFSPWKHIVFR